MNKKERAMAVATFENPVNAPVTETYRAIVDLDGWDDWFGIHDAWPDGAPGPLRAGLVFRQTMTIVGGTDTVTWTVEELVDSQSVSLFARGTFGGSIRMRLNIVPAPERCVVQGALEIFTPRRLAMFVPGAVRNHVVQAMSTEMTYHLRRLDALLQGLDVADVPAPTLDELMGRGAVLAPLLSLGSRFATKHVDAKEMSRSVQAALARRNAPSR